MARPKNKRNIDVNKGTGDIYDSPVQFFDNETIEELQKAQVELSGGRLVDSQDPKSLKPATKFYDPMYVLDFLSNKTKNQSWSISYFLLRKVSLRNGVIASIINTRLNQVEMFAHQYLTPNDRIGYYVAPVRQKFENLRRQVDPTYKVQPITQEELDMIQETMTFLEHCGNPEDMASDPLRENFRTFLKKITRDSLTFDQMCFEIVKDPKTKKPRAFYPVDSGTIRIADTKTKVEKGIHYVQWIDGTLHTAYKADEMAFCVRNPISDIKANGYGISEVEMAFNYISSLINAETYNSKYFCAIGKSLITTNKGIYKLSELHEMQRPQDMKVWTGDSWADFTTYQTGKKESHRTIFSDGTEVGTSNQHLFRCIGKNAELIWKKQNELTEHDVILKSVSEYNNEISPIYSFKHEGHTQKGRGGKTYRTTNNKNVKGFEFDGQLSEEFCEFLGQVYGDGTIQLGNPETDTYKKPNSISCLYRTDQDLELMNKHKKMLEDMGLYCGVNVRSQIKTAPGEQLFRLMIYNYAFVKFVVNCLGFDPKKQNLPKFIFTESRNNIAAFLRGFFNADGCVSSKRIAIKQKNKQAVAETKALLSMLGISSTTTSHTNKQGKTADTLHISNTTKYKKEVGFSTDYKNNKETILIDRKVIPEKMKFWLNDYFTKNYGSPYSGSEKSIRMGLTFVEAFRAAYENNDKKLMNLLENYYFVNVRTKEDLQKSEEMYDIEVIGDDRHQFSCDGIIVHNTQGSTPKGMLNIKGGTSIPQEELDAFRRAWHAQLAGVNNAWKTPILASEGVEWINFNMSSKEMEFSRWMEYLVNVICAVYQIDPVEINFPNKGGVSGQSKALSDSSTLERIKFSKDKGLVPLLKFIESSINRYIVYPMTDGKAEFLFYGYTDTIDDVKSSLEMKESQYLRTPNEIRAGYGLPELKGGDVILNPTYVQYRGQLEMAEQQAAQAAAEQGQANAGNGPTAGPVPPEAGQTPDNGVGSPEFNDGQPQQEFSPVSKQPEFGLKSMLSEVIKKIRG